MFLIGTNEGVGFPSLAFGLYRVYLLESTSYINSPEIGKAYYIWTLSDDRANTLERNFKITVCWFLIKKLNKN